MLSIANESDFNTDYGLYVVKFWAPWCGPCRMYNPIIEKLNDEFESINFLSVDTDQVPELAKKFRITSLPTLVIIADGKEKQRVMGLSMITPRISHIKKDEVAQENFRKEFKKNLNRNIWVFQ